MRKVIVRYNVKEGRGDENAGLVEKVFAGLKEASPAGLRYASFRGDDGLTFVHVAIVEAESNPLAESPAFKEFQKEIRDRCDEPPVALDVTEVGSYQFFG